MKIIKPVNLSYFEAYRDGLNDGVHELEFALYKERVKRNKYQVWTMFAGGIVAILAYLVGHYG